MNLTKKEVIEQCKKEARRYGLVFSKCKHGMYMFHDRKTKEVILSNMSLGSAYNHVFSGYISCYDKGAQSFNKEYQRNLVLID